MSRVGWLNHYNLGPSSMTNLLCLQKWSLQHYNRRKYLLPLSLTYPLDKNIQTLHVERDDRDYSGIVSRQSAHGARFITVLSYNKMEKNAKLHRSMMRQRLPREAFGFNRQSATTPRGLQRWRYRTHTEPWPEVPEPVANDYIEHLLLTKDSAPGPDGLPYAFWRMFPEQSAVILQDDFDRMMSCELPAPTQVGVWIPKASQGPTADFFRPLGMPDTLDRPQDGTAAAILFRTTRCCFHPAQTMLDAFQVLEVQRMLEGEIPASALFADLSKAFERVNAYWILQVSHSNVPRGSCSWPSTHCLAEEFATKFKNGCCLRVKSSQVLTWDDLPQCFLLSSDGPNFRSIKSGSKSPSRCRVC